MRKTVVVGMALILVLVGLPLAGHAQDPRPDVPEIEVETELLTQMAADETVGYMIYFRARPDLTPAYQMDWNERGWFVMNALQETAGRTQARVKAYLDAQGAQYQPFWIDNIIVVQRSDRATFDGLLNFPEIAALRAERIMQVIEPVQRDATGASPLVVEPNLTHVQVDQVWALGYRGEGMVVSNIDTGVRYTHEVLVRQYRGCQDPPACTVYDHDYNWLDPDSGNNTPFDDHGHGSHTMGTMVGEDAPLDNQTGMAPGAQWIACDGCNSVTGCPGASLLTCAQWVAAPYPIGNPGSPDPNMRPHIVNNSWGDCGTTYNSWYQGSVDSWHAAGIYPIFSNGNASNCGYSTPPGCNTVGNPARYGNVTGVGSTGQQNGQYATHSNWGPTDNDDTVNPRGYPDIKPQVVAPGVNIRSSLNGSDSAYGSWGGTSMSAPHVSGLIVLMWQACPDLIGDYATTETILETTATPIDYNSNCPGGNEGPGNIPNYATGWGEIDALAAVQEALNQCTPDFTIDATPDSQEICAPADAVYDVDIGQIAGYSDPVTLSTSGRPAGTTESWSVNPVIPPGSSVLTIGNTAAAAPGTYSIDVIGTAAGPNVHQDTVTLIISSGVPGAPTLVSPADGAIDIPLFPTFTWSAVAGATSYYLEVATDPGFVTVVYNATETGTSHTASSALNPSTLYYWRVTAQNACGSGGTSAVWSFTTVATTFVCGSLVDFNGGIPGDWTVVDNEGNGVVWDDLAGCGEGGNYTGGTGDPACASSDVAGPVQYDTELQSPVFDLTGYGVASVDYVANYQNYAARDYLEVDISTDGGGSWTILLSWNEDHGTFRGTPGVAVSVDLSAYVGMSGLMLRWHYYDPTTDDYDWYAQIDDVELVCTPVPDIDVSPTSLNSSQPPTWQVTQTLTINNNGFADLTWDLYEKDTLGAPVPNVPQVENEVAPNSLIYSHPSAFSDELYQIDAQASTGHIALLGVEYANGYYWVTSGGASGSADPNYLFQLDNSGAVVNSWPQGTGSTWGWRDLAFDGTYLYASDSAVVDQIDPATGSATGVTIPCPTNPCRALAYDPATDHFWTQNFNSSLWEFDRSGTVINTFGGTSGLAAYGAAWDADSIGGPYLWLWTQDGPDNNRLVTATQVDPATGNPTGVSFLGSRIGGGDNIAGGATISADVVPGTLVFVGMHQAAADTIVGYELAPTACTSPSDVPWATIAPTSGTTAAGNSSPIDATFDSTGYLPGTYTADLCVSSNDPDTPLIGVSLAMTVQEVDFSDLDNSYGIAWHVGDGSFRLGNAWDSDTTFGLGDDDASDDGVTFPGGFQAGQPATVRVNVQGTPTNGRWLRLWFDWDENGVFDDDELEYDNTVNDGDNDIGVNVPGGYSQPVYYRARLYDSAGAPLVQDPNSYGAASGGEVEDGESPGPTAVRLAFFEAFPAAGGILLTWETESEWENLGFNLYRSVVPDSLGEQLNEVLIPSQSPGGGLGAVYKFLDETAETGVAYYYTLEDVDYGGQRTQHGPVVLALWHAYLPLVWR